MSSPPDLASSDPTGLATEPPGEEARYTLILNYIVAVFLQTANNDPDLARQAAIEALDECEAATMPEVDAAARAICLDHAAMDSLGKSMSPSVTDPQRIRYRNQAVALTRAAELARGTLAALRARRLTRQSAARADALYATQAWSGTPAHPASSAQPRPAPPKPAKPAAAPRPTQRPAVAAQAQSAADPATATILADDNLFPLGLQAMQRASRAMLADLQSRLADPGPPPEVPPNAFRFGQNGFRPDHPAA